MTNHLRITVKVTPRAGKSEVVGWEGDVLKVRVKAAPEHGEANEEVERLLSKYFNAEVEVVGGRKSRRKIVLIKNTTET